MTAPPTPSQVRIAALYALLKLLALCTLLITHIAFAASCSSDPDSSGIFWDEKQANRELRAKRMRLDEMRKELEEAENQKITNDNHIHERGRYVHEDISSLKQQIAKLKPPPGFLAERKAAMLRQLSGLEQECIKANNLSSNSARLNKLTNIYNDLELITNEYVLLKNNIKRF